MLAITLGFHDKGRTAPPVVLYVGNDAGAAEVPFLAPPDGIIRTEMIKAPVITRRRFFEQPAATVAPIEDPAPKPSKAKA